MDNHLLSNDSFTLKQLFEEPLYLIKSEFQSQEKPLFQLVGENSKNIVFIVFSEDKSLSIIDNDLFLKTLAGLKLNNADIGFCITDLSQAKNFEVIANQLANQRIVCFGNSTTYTEDVMLKSTSIGSSSFLTCPSLFELSLDQDLKVKWWNALKAFVN